MFETIRNALKIKDVRNKILWTILFVVIYRLGCYITVPGLQAISIEEGLALVAVVGRGMVKSKGCAAKALRAVAKADINIRMIDQGSSELNIIIGISEDDFETTLKVIYDEFCRN